MGRLSPEEGERYGTEGPGLSEGYGRDRVVLRGPAGGVLTLKLLESSTNVLTPRVHWEWASLRGVDVGLRGEAGASRAGGRSPVTVVAGLTGGLWGTQSDSTDVGLRRPEGPGASDEGGSSDEATEAEVTEDEVTEDEAGGLTLEAVLLRLSRDVRER